MELTEKDQKVIVIKRKIAALSVLHELGAEDAVRQFPDLKSFIKEVEHRDFMSVSNELDKEFSATAQS